MAFCPNCGSQIDDAAVMCPKCGKMIEHKHAKKDRKVSHAWKLVIAVLFAINGLRGFGQYTLIMVLNLCIAFGFLVWWVLTRDKE